MNPVWCDAHKTTPRCYYANMLRIDCTACTLPSTYLPQTNLCTCARPAGVIVTSCSVVPLSPWWATTTTTTTTCCPRWRRRCWHSERPVLAQRQQPGPREQPQQGRRRQAQGRRWRAGRFLHFRLLRAGRKARGLARVRGDRGGPC